ncbi:hypothetical protein SAMN04487850_0930 [Prevotella aff. ruminicola Tc2-24]|uniref:Uncharacterized protein n=1 Tax=Prevotella aff. ruminicola Tc2-24 TaxID=81582 RepID=A0A1I0N4N6_9BACT|nr:hypothetical protein SAMN04487850_0930 [Prevotella aff. ruminicola Tc2-24]
MLFVCKGTEKRRKKQKSTAFIFQTDIVELYFYAVTSQNKAK